MTCYECHGNHPPGACPGFRMFPGYGATMSYSRATHGTWQCPYCKLWYHDQDGHDTELCESDRDDAADHKRREKRDEPRNDDDR